MVVGGGVVLCANSQVALNGVSPLMLHCVQRLSGEEFVCDGGVFS